MGDVLTAAREGGHLGGGRLGKVTELGLDYPLVRSSATCETQQQCNNNQSSISV